MRAIRVDWWIKLLFVLPYRHPRWVDFCPAFVHKKHVVKRTRIDGSELVTFCRPNSKHTSTHIVFFMVARMFCLLLKCIGNGWRIAWIDWAARQPWCAIL